jgi:hypothetical protein
MAQTPSGNPGVNLGDIAKCQARGLQMLQELRGVVSGDSYAIIKEAMDNANDAYRDVLEAPNYVTFMDRIERLRVMTHRQAQAWYKYGAPYVKEQCIACSLRTKRGL